MHTDTLEAMCELVVDCPHSTPVWTDHGKVVLRNQNIRNGRLDLASASYTDNEHFLKRITRAKPQAGDIVITREAPMGEVCMIPDGLECCLGQRQVLLRPKPKVDGRYLLFALQSPYVRNQISWNEGTGSTVSNIRIPVLKRILVPRHPSEEESIADVLSTLADKIELNRQINQTLEQMAQAIFKSWFVDFDPVHAKVQAIKEGRDPIEAAARVIGNPALEQVGASLREIAELFPSEFVESELGLIPKGWGVKSLDQIADYLNGLACQKYPPEEGKPSLPVIKIRELRQGITENTDMATSGVPSNYIVNDGDVLFSWSGSLMIDIWTKGKGVLNQHLFKVTSKTYPKWFYFYWTNYHLAEFQNIAAHKATTMGHIKRHHLRDAKCFVADEGLLNIADKQIASLLCLRINNEKEINGLATLRDTLLPKLLSGELTLEVDG